MDIKSVHTPFKTAAFYDVKNGTKINNIRSFSAFLMWFSKQQN